jgi:redox-sensitive bicupin YhaK (pirin superfamily)
VTYLFAGENVHRDSLGTVQTNRPGDINLMTAGRGIVHSERADPAFRAAGGAMHGVQLWVALPEADEDGDPSFEHHPERTLPPIAPAPGVTGRVLIGAMFGARSPIRHASDPLLVDLRLADGSTVELAGDAPERGVMVIEGALSVDGQPLRVDQMAVLSPGSKARLAATGAARAIVVGGPPLGARYIEWNFVASTRERIERAREEWKALTLAHARDGSTDGRSRFPVIPTDAEELVPYPT